MLEIYGASDDLIEVEGDVREEFSALSWEEDGAFIALSSGTVLRIRYVHGVWRIAPVVVHLLEKLVIDQAPEDDEDNYSDRARIEGPVSWVVVGAECAKASNGGLKSDG